MKRGWKYTPTEQEAVELERLRDLAATAKVLRAAVDLSELDRDASVRNLVGRHRIGLGPHISDAAGFSSRSSPKTVAYTYPDRRRQFKAGHPDPRAVLLAARERIDRMLEQYRP